MPHILCTPDILALNNTRVLSARLTGYRELTGGKWEGLFLQQFADGSWELLTTTRGRPQCGEYIIVGKGLRLQLLRKTQLGCWVARPLQEEHSTESLSTFALLQIHGQVPLPPYIYTQKDDSTNRSSYQTIYADELGSVAAPTAGLHFSDDIFVGLAKRGISWTYLTLHIGVGTFRPISTKFISDHFMHAEWAELSASAVTELNNRRDKGGRIVAVGSTSARTLETAASSEILTPFSGQTNLFIRPGYRFQGTDALITNFHLPKSTLLVLVSAFAGVEVIREAYREAIHQQYRFFSYGDTMLIL